MAEIKKEAVKTQSSPEIPKTKEASPKPKIGLVEMIMILMLVGLVFVFIFPFQQMKVDKEKEAIAQQRFEAVLPIIDKIIAGAEAYKKQDEFGAYPILIDELNLGDISTEYFSFEYSDQGPTITAVSKEAFGKKDIKVSYNMSTKSFNIEDPSPQSIPTVKEEWLP